MPKAPLVALAKPTFNSPNVGASTRYQTVLFGSPAQEQGNSPASWVAPDVVAAMATWSALDASVPPGSGTGCADENASFAGAGVRSTSRVNGPSSRRTSALTLTKYVLPAATCSSVATFVAVSVVLVGVVASLTSIDPA